MVLFVNPLTPRVKRWVIQSFLTFDSMERTLSVTIHWKAVEQYFTVCNFEEFVNCRFDTVRSETVKSHLVASFRTNCINQSKLAL